jgi:hypothetical protein
MHHRLALLVAASVLVSLPAFADPPSETRTAPASGAGAAVAPTPDRDLARIHGKLNAEGTRVAGQSRDVQMTPTKTTATAVQRPAATPRTLRKMNGDRAMAAVDPAIRACAVENTATTPTTIALRLSVGPSGEVESVEPATAARVPAPLLSCVVGAVTSAKFGAPGPIGASLVLPVTVPGRQAAVPATPEPTAAAAPPPPQEAKPAPEAVAATQ